MTSPQKFVTAPHYSFNLNYSKKALSLEIFFHGLILVCIVNVIQGWWSVPVVLLFLLLTLRFFQVDSIVAQFKKNTVIEFRHDFETLLWSDETGSTAYSTAEIKIFMTRWFILLQLGKGKTRINRLLLADSFDDISHYTCFRRQLIEKYLC